MAGKVWSESPRERQQRLARERLSGKSKSIPVGVGFGENDDFGPDDTYHTVQFLNNTRGQVS